MRIYAIYQCLHTISLVSQIMLESTPGLQLKLAHKTPSKTFNKLGSTLRKYILGVLMHTTV